MIEGFEFLLGGILQFLFIFGLIYFFVKTTTILGENKDLTYICLSLILVSTFYFIKTLLELTGIGINIIPIIQVMLVVLVLNFIVIISLERKHVGLQIFFIILFSIGFISTVLYWSELLLKSFMVTGISQDRFHAYIDSSYLYLVIVVNETGALLSYIIIRAKLTRKILEFSHKLFFA